MNKNVGFVGLKTAGFALVLALGTINADRALAQAAAATTGTPNVQGHVQNSIGQPIHGDVKFTTDKGSADNNGKIQYKWQFSFPLDANGDYKGVLPPNQYFSAVYADGKTVDFQDVTIKPGQAATANFDMTRADYIAKLSPEEQKQIEEIKKKNAGAQAYNAKVADLNKTMLQARADAAAGKTAEAVAAMQGLTQQKPDEALLWVTLGEVQLADANAAAKAARAAHTSPMDGSVVGKYEASAASYQKGIDLNQATGKPNKELISKGYLNMGEDLAKAGKTKEASDAYEKCVAADPALASTAYYNEAAIFYNAQKLQEANAAADKAIAADPKRAEAYYIKAQALIPAATVDPKTQKIVAPPGCIEAYQEYLELAPTGAHAAEVKDLLTNLGQPIVNSFKAGKKK